MFAFSGVRERIWLVTHRLTAVCEMFESGLIDGSVCVCVCKHVCYVPLLLKVTAPAVVCIWTLNIEQPELLLMDFFFLTGFAFMFF